MCDPNWDNLSASLGSSKLELGEEQVDRRKRKKDVILGLHASTTSSVWRKSVERVEPQREAETRLEQRNLERIPFLISHPGVPILSDE